MKNNRLLKFGLIGTAISALCCFTPALVLLVSVIGLSALIGYLDYFLLPSLAFFIVLTGYAIWKNQTIKSN